MIPIVIKPPASALLTSIANARADLGLAESAYPDAKVTRMIKSASSQVVGYCHRAFGRQIVQERIHTVARNDVSLALDPVNAIVSLGLMGGAAFDPSEYLLAGGQLRLTDGPGTGIGDGSAYNLWRSFCPSFVVTYETGYLLPGEAAGSDFVGTEELPGAIEKAVMQLMSVAISEAGRDITIRQESNEGVGSVSYYVQGAGASLPHPGAEAALQPYRFMALV